MSNYSNLTGTISIEVTPTAHNLPYTLSPTDMQRLLLLPSQPTLDFILHNTLSSLPDVNPNPHSESDFSIYINQTPTTTMSDSHAVCIQSHSTVPYPTYISTHRTPSLNLNNLNRFIPSSPLHPDCTPTQYLNTNPIYLLTVHGSFRDVLFTEALKSFTNWLTRLSKKLWVRDVFVKVSGYDVIGVDEEGWNRYEYKTKVINSEKFGDMFENE